MSKEKCINRLRRYSLLSQLASVFVVIVGIVCIILFIQPTLVGVEPESTGTYQGQLIWVIFGMFFVAIGIFFNVIAYRWPRTLLRILRTQPSSPMRFQLEVTKESDHTQYYAYLSEPYPVGNTTSWRIGLWAVSSGIELWLNRVCSARVYRDPETNDPAVIELEDMVLWAMKGDVQPIPSRDMDE